MTSDLELLQTYHQTRSDEAFRTLIERHMPMVYAACRRQLRDDHLAQDATQGVFVVLSQKAGKLRHPTLAGWLLTTARYACSSIRRTQTRQERRERIVAMNPDLNRDHVPPRDSEELLALLDEGLHRLAEPERQAVVLRYLQDQSFKDVGSNLGISEEAARKRVDRGMHKLRYYFARRGIQTSAPAVAAILTNQAHAALLPPDLSASITQGILQACHAGASSTSAGLLIAKGVHSMIFIAKLKAAALIAAIIAVLISGGWIATHALAQNNAAATPPPTVAIKTAATATSPAVDLTTPQRTLTALSQGLKSSDRAQVYACLNIDPEAPATLQSAAVNWNLEENRKNHAARKAFGDAAVDLRNGVPADALIDVLLATGPKTQITGNTATMQFTFPPQIVAMLPADTAAAAKSWQDKPIRFIKRGDQWKIDLEHTMNITVTAFGAPEVPPAELLKRNIALISGLAAVQEEVAVMIERGEAKTLADAQELTQTKTMQMLQRQGASGFNFDAIPADPAQ